MKNLSTLHNPSVYDKAQYTQSERNRNDKMVESSEFNHCYSPVRDSIHARREEDLETLVDIPCTLQEFM